MLFAAKLFAIAGLFKASDKLDKTILASFWAIIFILLGFMGKVSFTGLLIKAAIGFAIVYVSMGFLRKFDEMSMEWIGICLLTTAALLFFG